MSNATEFLNNLVAEAKAKGGNVASAFGYFNGKFVLVRATLVNTNSKENVYQIRYTVERKVVSAAKIIATLENEKGA